MPELLASEYYTSSRIFDEEFERLFGSQWLFAGHVSQIALPGDFMTFTYGGEELILVRGESGEVHAHFNFCRHRGFRLCTDGAGSTRRFVCPYHQWTYRLDGRLIAAPHSRDGDHFDYADYSLRSVPAEIWHGLVFVYLGADQPPPLTERMSEFEASVALFDPIDTKVAHAMSWDLDVNWKVVVENALECYHCPGSHDTFCGVVDVPRLRSGLGDWLEAGDESRAQGGAGGVALRPGMQTMSPDGTLITSKLLGTCSTADAERAATAGVLFVPNYFYAGFYVDHWWTHAVRPLSATKTELVYTWYVRGDAEEGIDYELAKLLEVGLRTTVEDNELCARTQAGVASRRFTPGPLVDSVEPALHDFAQSYRSLMGLQVA